MEDPESSVDPTDIARLWLCHLFSTFLIGGLSCAFDDIWKYRNLPQRCACKRIDWLTPWWLLLWLQNIHSCASYVYGRWTRKCKQKDCTIASLNDGIVSWTTPYLCFSKFLLLHIRQLILPQLLGFRNTLVDLILCMTCLHIHGLLLIPNAWLISGDAEKSITGYPQPMI